MMDEAKKIKKQIKKYKLKLQDKLFEILNTLTNKDVQIEGLNLEELTRKVMNKHYVARKETQTVYKFITEYRKTIPDLICFERKYGFPNNREQLESVMIDRVNVIVGHQISLRRMSKAASIRLGFNGRINKFIENKMKERLYDESSEKEEDKPSKKERR